MKCREKMGQLNLIFVMLTLACAASAADLPENRVPRLGVKIMLRSTGKACDTFGSSMQDEHLVCVDNEWKIRYYLITYKFRGEIKTVESPRVPGKTFRIDESGNVIQPDTTMHGHY